DGRWLAVAGKGLMRDTAGYREPGIILPRDLRLDDDMRQDEGTIYLFDTTRERENVRALRGHRGPVLALAFAPGRKPQDKPPLLASVGREPEGRKHAAALRLWDAGDKEGKQIAETAGLPDPRDGRPALALWHTGPGPLDLGVVLASYAAEPDLGDPR